jgi:excisionase family DNA binding protein
MNTPLQIVLEQARSLPVSQLPRLLADLREVECTALARLSTPSPAPVAEEWLTVAQASERLHCSRVYLYKNAHTLPFARHLGKKLLFSARGIEDYLQQKS